MLVVNLYGGPGCGKSTGAAYIFVRLKEQGVKTELVTEFAKDLTYDHSGALGDQTYVFANQLHRLVRCENDGVQVAVTDSPLLLSLIYRKNGPLWGSAFVRYVYAANACFSTRDVLVNRVKPYATYGRLQNEAEAKRIDDEIRRLPIVFDLTIDGETAGYDRVVETVLSKVRHV